MTVSYEEISDLAKKQEAKNSQAYRLLPSGERYWKGGKEGREGAGTIMTIVRLRKSLKYNFLLFFFFFTI